MQLSRAAAWQRIVHDEGWRPWFSARSLALLGTLGLVLYLVLAPLGIALAATFKGEGYLPFEASPLTLTNYARVFLDPTTWTLLVNTTLFAVGSLALGATFAIGFSWLVERTDLPARELIFSLIIAPMAMPGMLAAIAWVFLLDPTVGMLNLIARAVPGVEMTRGPFNIYTLGGMVLVEGLRMVPTLFLMISGPFRAMDPSLEEASRVAGRSGPRTLLYVTLPLMRPAILAALLYYFVVAIEAFEIPGVLGLSAGVHLFSTRIYWATTPASGGLPDYGMASTLGLILIAISLVLMWLYSRATAQARRFVTVTGRGYRPQRVRLGWWTVPALGLCGVYVLFAFGLPLFILVWASVHRFYVPPSWAGLATVSFEPYLDLMRYPGTGTALVNTLILAVMTATATIGLSLLVAWFTVRQRSGLTRVLDNVAFLPQALPSIVIGLAVLVLYLSFPNPLYGTLVLIAVALTTRYLAYGSRAAGTGLLQIHPELEEASQVAGVGWWRTCWRIIIPLAAPVLVNAWIWVAVHATREISIAVMLYTPSSLIISAELWSLWNGGKTPVAAALGVSLIVTLVLVNWLARALLGRMRAF
jgi:iron(III) transport system permease protein